MADRGRASRWAARGEAALIVTAVLGYWVPLVTPWTRVVLSVALLWLAAARFVESRERFN